MKDDLFRFILKLVKFPYSKLCRHYVALELLNMMEKNGINFPSELVSSLSEGSYGDEESERILSEFLSTTEPNELAKDKVLKTVVNLHCAHIQKPYTLDEICNMVLENEYNSEQMLQHLLLWVFANETKS